MTAVTNTRQGETGGNSSIDIDVGGRWGGVDIGVDIKVPIPDRKNPNPDHPANNPPSTGTAKAGIGLGTILAAVGVFFAMKK